MKVMLDFLKNGRKKKEKSEPKKEEKVEAGMDKKSLKAYEAKEK